MGHALQTLNVHIIYIKFLCIYIKINKKYNGNSKMTVYLIECQINGEQYTRSTKTKFRSRANNYKSKQCKFMNKEEVPKQTLKQKSFNEQRHNGKESWVITLIDGADTLKVLRRKELHYTYVPCDLNERDVYEVFF